MEPMLEDMARSLVESGDYRVTSRLEPQAEYHPPDSSPKLVAAVVELLGVKFTGSHVLLPFGERSNVVSNCSVFAIALPVTCTATPL